MQEFDTYKELTQLLRDLREIRRGIKDRDIVTHLYNADDEIYRALNSLAITKATNQVLGT